MTMRRKKSALSLLLIILAVIAFIVWGGGELVKQQPTVPQDGQLTLHVIDVGQGSANLINLPDGKVMLVDAGSSATGTVAYLKSQGITRIDYLVATHPHEDHIGAMDEVVKAFDIGAVYMPRVPDKLTPTIDVYLSLLKAVKDKHLTIHPPGQGELIAKGEGLAVQVLSDAKADYDNLNDYSIVLRITYGTVDILLPGDAGSAAQSDILNEYDIASEVYLVAHHGSAYGAADWIEAISPREAIISAGEDNSYGHPAPSILEALDAAGARVWRTDQQGTLIITTEGVDIAVQTVD